MTRYYISRPKMIEPQNVPEEYWHNDHRTITVFEEEDSRPTGLLDSRGNQIYSCNRIGPIGFGRGT